MASYTFTTTSDQEALLTWIVSEANRQKDTTYTNAQYVQVRFPELLAPYAEAYKQHLKNALATAFESAAPATQAQVLQLLGVS